MKLKSFQHGEMITLSVSPESPNFQITTNVGQEVRLQFPQSGDETFVAFSNDNTLAVIPTDDSSRRRLETLRQTDPVRIVWLAGQHKQSGRETFTLQVHRFRTKWQLDETLMFGVDERIIERVSKLAGKSLNIQETFDWLKEKVTLPQENNDHIARFVVTGAFGQGGKFRILGNRIGVDVLPEDETLRVDTVATLSGAKQGFLPPQTLIEGCIEFVDSTVAGKMRQSIKARLDKIVEESDSYLALWRKYQSIEWQNLVRRAKELGWLYYNSFEALPNGLWKFKIKGNSKEDYLRFQSNLTASDYEDLETGTEIPPELLDKVVDEDEDSNDRNRSAVGKVERFRPDVLELLLRPIDEDNDVLPPKEGYLFAAMHGDRTRLRRREQAVKRIKSADARLPQLGLILEGHPAQIRRSDTVRTFSKAVRDIFSDEPTQAQRDAINIALNTPDIAIIQGPPGTGKTKVITAIQVRLAELESEQPELAGRTLLTSYQHDAVDHAVSKSRVYGLPPVRLGGRMDGSNTREDEIQRWTAQAKEHIDASLADFSEERPLAIYKTFRDLAAAYAAGCLPNVQLIEVIDNLIALPAGTLPTNLWDRLKSLRRKAVTVSGTGSNNFDDELRIKTVRGLRVTQESFSDDGPRKARQVLKMFEISLSSEDQTLLQAAVETPPGESFKDLSRLATFKDQLLDQLAGSKNQVDNDTRDPEIMDALNLAVSSLYQRMKTSKGGVADALQEFSDALKMDPRGVQETLESYSAVYAASCQQAVGHQMVDAKGGEKSDLSFENVIVDEAARANPLDLFIPISLATRRIILVGDHRQLPHILEPDIEKELSDNASELTRKALKESLFQRLFEDLRKREQQDGYPRVITLDSQYRMHPTLGNFVSRVFYEPHESFKSPRPASDFIHGISGYMKAGKPVCAAWKDIPLREKGEVQGISKSRPSEAKWIAKEIRRLLIDDGSAVNIGVITFYRAQVDKILDAFISEGLAEKDPDTDIIKILPEWRTLERSDGSRDERLRVGTVDAFQGKEFDIVFLSVTRSNSLPSTSEEELRKKFGHLMLANRLCVAMSRQRRLLVAVGDKQMFSTNEAQNAVSGLSHFLEICGGEDGLVI